MTTFGAVPASAISEVVADRLGEGALQRLVVRARGSELSSPTFSRSGRRIAFSREFKDPDSGVGRDAVHIAQVKPQAPRPTRVPGTEGFSVGPVDRIGWAPANAIAVSLGVNDRVGIVRPGGRRSPPLTSGLAPDWSPSGSALAFYRARTTCEPDVASIAVVPSSRRGFRAGPCEGTEVTRSNLYTIRRSGRRLRRVTSRGYPVNPIWSPGSSHVAFLDFPREILYMISLTTGRRRVIALNAYGYGGISWQARPRRTPQAR
jgi:dipeptidyl aminopeptidase/acylaminoacyl peptidase